MDSINNNQQEENYKDITGEEGIKKIKELIDKAQSCFFCTNITSGRIDKTRPMAVQKTDEEGNLWFLSASDSKKNLEIQSDKTVQLFFQGSPYADFLTITGTANVTKDKAIIKELWNPMLKTWFTEGEDDERITAIKVVPEEAYYWDTKNALPVSFIKRLIGAAIGKTIDDSIEGTIKL